MFKLNKYCQDLTYMRYFTVTPLCIVGDSDAVTMVTNSVVLQLAITLMVTLTTTFGGSGKAFRLKTISQRSRSNSLPHYMAVLDRLDQLTSLVRDLQTAVDDMHDTVKMINDSVNPSVVRQFFILSLSYCFRD